MQKLEDHAIKRRVFQSSLLALGQGRSDGECDNNIIGVLRQAVGGQLSAFCSQIYPMEAGNVEVEEEDSHLVDGLLPRCDLREHVLETLCGHV